MRSTRRLGEARAWNRTASLKPSFMPMILSVAFGSLRLQAVELPRAGGSGGERRSGGGVGGPGASHIVGLDEPEAGGGGEGEGVAGEGGLQFVAGPEAENGVAVRAGGA